MPKGIEGFGAGGTGSQLYYCRSLEGWEEGVLKGVLPLGPSTPHYDLLLLVGHGFLMDPNFPPPFGLCIWEPCRLPPVLSCLDRKHSGFEPEFRSRQIWT